MINFLYIYHKNSYSILFLLLFLSGCSFRKSLKKLPHFNQSHDVIENDLSVYAHAYTAHDAHAFFGVNLLLYGFQPIQFNMINNTSKSFFIRPGYIDRELIPSERIFPFIKTDASLFVYAAGLPSFLYYWPLVPLFVAPVGYGIYRENKDVKKLLRQHTLEEQDTIEIKPYSSVEKIIFVSTSGAPEVTLQFYHQVEGTLKTFDFNTV